MRSLPHGWAEAKLGDLVGLANGRAFGKAEWSDHGLPIIRIQNLNSPSAAFNYYSGSLPERFSVKPGDLLFAWSGTPGTSFGAHIWRGEPGWLNQHIYRVDFERRLLDPTFLRLAINQNLDGYIRSAHGGAGLAHITKKEFEASSLVLAPLPEQRRIVAKIEELFSELDAGVQALERTVAKLERYRASVLKAAVEGKLTEEWRRANPPQETGEQLLARILDERRRRWEDAQLASYAAKGKEPPTNWRAKYKEPAKPDVSELPELPEGWCWASFESLCDLQLGKMLSPKARADSGSVRPYLRNLNVRWFSIDLTDVKEMSFQGDEIQRFAVRRGDLLICEGGEPGRCAVYQGAQPVFYQKALHRARPYSGLTSPGFIQYCLAHQVRTGLGMPRYSETTIKHLTLEKLREVPLPVPPRAEQRAIADLIDSTLSALAWSARSFAELARGLATLRRSILTAAFEGRLVPQDPNDEPASILLERIRAQREDVPATRTQRRKAKVAAESES